MESLLELTRAAVLAVSVAVMPPPESVPEPAIEPVPAVVEAPARPETVVCGLETGCRAAARIVDGAPS